MNTIALEEKITEIINKRFKREYTREYLTEKNLLSKEIGLSYCDLLLLYFDIKEQFKKPLSDEFIKRDNNFAYVNRIAKSLSE